jgi:hypothetical protein
MLKFLHFSFALPNTFGAADGAKLSHLRPFFFTAVDLSR